MLLVAKFVPDQDLAAHMDALTELGVSAERIYVGKGLTDTIGPARVCARPSQPVGPATRWW